MTSPRHPQRLLRLLNLVPYFKANPGISLTEAAAEMGISTDALTKDLDLLWMCGLPGHRGGDLIDLSVSENSVEVSFTAGFDRPLRLTSLEATSLVLALRILVDQPSSIEPTAALSAIAKIEQATGVAAAAHLPSPDPAEAVAAAANPAAETVRSAVSNRHALRLHYYSATRDALTDRVADPIRVRLVDGQSYLEAWCRQSEGLRLFRFDRIYSAEELSEPAVAHVDVPEASPDHGGIFEPDADLPTVRLRIEAESTWLLEYYALEVDAEFDDGGVEATLRYASPEWLLRLLLGFGSQVSIVGDTELSARLTDAAAAARAAYADSESLLT
ncbi:helix-turn-helix transcriptional regulator [Tomitella biformata]|uniref:helix-turn-helix transcriptional regulator n=1 Tax=Tomitella biformata TaxID=630403 RepID=UPI000465A731|nr:WYL domain-containing protein [Tomitella biformata]